MRNFLSTLAIQQLEGGTYTIDTVLKVIKQITDWALAVGISLAGIALDYVCSCRCRSKT